MSKRVLFALSLPLAAGLVVLSLAQADPPAAATEKPEPAAAAKKAGPSSKEAQSRVTHVTVYQNNALITRDVTVPEGTGTFEVIVSPLPSQTMAGSLYSEGLDGIRVLNTRYRTRATKEDTRDEVRKLETQLKDLQTAAAKLQADIQAVEQNMLMLTKLEGFTASSLQHVTDKGIINGEQTITLAKYVMETRAEKTRDKVALQQSMATNTEQVQFIQRQLQELATGRSTTEHDAVILLDKRNPAPGKVKLNYLVDSASWRPQYKFRAGKTEKEAVQIEYLAGVQQQTGEDWTDVDVTLSTAQPMLNAAPPDLKMLEVAVAPAANPMPQPGTAGFKDLDMQRKNLRGQAQQEYNRNSLEAGGKFINDAAAIEQNFQLLASKQEQEKAQREGWSDGTSEGQSVTYDIKTKLSLPSRTDEQVIEITKLDMAPEYFYKAVPVLTPHVYRLANLTNKSGMVLLPGEATMYLATSYVGRTVLPLVADGEQFTAGFGVDPQLQVRRQMVDKTDFIQGGNKVLEFDYRILVNSYKPEPVKLMLCDRLPHAEGKTIAVTLVKQTPDLSTDSIYVRDERVKNLLRWDVIVKPENTSDKPLTITYKFKLELDKNMHIGSLSSK